MYCIIRNAIKIGDRFFLHWRHGKISIIAEFNFHSSFLLHPRGSPATLVFTSWESRYISLRPRGIAVESTESLSSPFPSNSLFPCFYRNFVKKCLDIEYVVLLCLNSHEVPTNSMTTCYLSHPVYSHSLPTTHLLTWPTRAV